MKAVTRNISLQLAKPVKPQTAMAEQLAKAISSKSLEQFQGDEAKLKILYHCSIAEAQISFGENKKELAEFEIGAKNRFLLNNYRCNTRTLTKNLTERVEWHQDFYKTSQRGLFQAVFKIHKMTTTC